METLSDEQFSGAIKNLSKDDLQLLAEHCATKDELNGKLELIREECASRGWSFYVGPAVPPDPYAHIERKW